MLCVSSQAGSQSATDSRHTTWLGMCGCCAQVCAHMLLCWHTFAVQVFVLQCEACSPWQKMLVNECAGCWTWVLMRHPVLTVVLLRSVHVAVCVHPVRECQVTCQLSHCKDRTRRLMCAAQAVAVHHVRHVVWQGTTALAVTGAD